MDKKDEDINKNNLEDRCTRNRAHPFLVDPGLAGQES